MAKIRKGDPLTDFEQNLLRKIGDKIRKSRTNTGDTNYQLWAFTNKLNPGFIGELERGQSDFKFLYLVKVLAALDISLEDFFSGFPEPKKKPTHPKRAK